MAFQLMAFQPKPFQLLVPPYENTESYCCHFDVSMGFGVGVGITLYKFYVKVFYMMGIALSGKLACMRIGLAKLPYHLNKLSML